jgi:hypothetical protein
MVGFHRQKHEGVVSKIFPGVTCYAPPIFLKKGSGLQAPRQHLIGSVQCFVTRLLADVGALALALSMVASATAASAICSANGCPSLFTSSACGPSATRQRGNN